VPANELAWCSVRGSPGACEADHFARGKGVIRDAVAGPVGEVGCLALLRGACRGWAGAGCALTPGWRSWRLGVRSDRPSSRAAGFAPRRRAFRRSLSGQNQGGCRRRDGRRSIPVMRLTGYAVEGIVPWCGMSSSRTSSRPAGTR